MSIFIDNLKHFFQLGKIDIQKLNKLKDESKITNEEYQYIISQ